jgi:hypothetical protein
MWVNITLTIRLSARSGTRMGTSRRHSIVKISLLRLYLEPIRYAQCFAKNQKIKASDKKPKKSLKKAHNSKKK